MDEKRRFSRLPFEAIVNLEFILDDKSNDQYKNELLKPNKHIPLQNGKSVITNGELLDISLNGALIRTPKDLDLPMNTEIILEIVFPMSNLTLIFTTSLVHSSDQCLGLKFISTDQETMAHLRRFFEFNVGDEEQVNREMSMLIRDL